MLIIAVLFAPSVSLLTLYGQQALSYRDGLRLALSSSSVAARTFSLAQILRSIRAMFDFYLKKFTKRESYMYEVLNVNYLQFFLKMSVTLRNESNDGN